MELRQTCFFCGLVHVVHGIYKHELKYYESNWWNVPCYCSQSGNKHIFWDRGEVYELIDMCCKNNYVI